jgi:radical SAM superfamily enzyme YgiQ (UPF0313 family)
MRFLLVRPQIILEVARRLRQFVHLEPLALEIVAGGIPEGHETRILDLASSQKPEHEFAARLESFRPDVVGFTGYSNQARAVKELAALARRLLPRCTVIVGGCHATIAPEDFRLPGVIDLVVRGEGGSVMPELVRELERDDGLPEGGPFLPTRSAAFDGLAARRPPALPPYERVPAPRRDLVDRSQYFSVWHGERREKLRTLFPRTAALRTSVGCTNRCSFCVVHYLANGKYLQREPEDVVEEIASVPEDHIYFVDDEMFLNARRCEAIACLLIERDVRKKYISWARADTICRSPDLFRLWKEAGLSLLYVGLESMQAETLRDYNKGTDPGTNRRAVRILHELGIGLHASLMVRPDFTHEDFLKARQTIDFVSPAEVSFTVFSPPPGTPLWEKHREEFICPDPYSFYDCMHTLLPTQMPLKRFYSQFALLYLIGTRKNPWRCNRVRVPLADLARFFWRGTTYGLALKSIWRDYEGLDGEE